MNTHGIELRSAVMGVITDVWDRSKQIDDAADEVLDLIEATFTSEVSMSIEQERTEFYAWLTRHCDYDDLNKSEIELARDAWQSRAALQSRDREDAERYRWLRDKSRVFKQDPDMSGNHYWMIQSNGLLRGATIDAAIDHARRIEGEWE